MAIDGYGGTFTLAHSPGGMFYIFVAHTTQVFFYRYYCIITSTRTNQQLAPCDQFVVPCEAQEIAEFVAVSLPHRHVTDAAEMCSLTIMSL